MDVGSVEEVNIALVDRHGGTLTWLKEIDWIRVARSKEP